MCYRIMGAWDSLPKGMFVWAEDNLLPYLKVRVKGTARVSGEGKGDGEGEE